jgi:prophage regulatory protein
MTTDLIVDTHPETPRRILGTTETGARLNIKRTSLYEFIRRGDFPRPLRIGKRSGWLESDIEHYIDGLVAKRAARGGK